MGGISVIWIDGSQVKGMAGKGCGVGARWQEWCLSNWELGRGCGRSGVSVTGCGREGRSVRGCSRQMGLVETGMAGSGGISIW